MVADGGVELPLQCFDVIEGLDVPVLQTGCPPPFAVDSGFRDANSQYRNVWRMGHGALEVTTPSFTWTPVCVALTEGSDVNSSLTSVFDCESDVMRCSLHRG
jgi:hypothetical protein